MAKPKTTIKSQFAANKTLWIVLGVVVIVGLGAWAWSASQGKYTPTTVTPQKSASPSPSPSSANAGQPGGRNLDTPAPTPVPTTSAQPGTPLPPPQGNMLNVHTATAGTSLITTCATSAGAKCHMQAKASDGTIKASPDITADGTGGAVISWTPNSVGLTAGSWEIRVVAANGSGPTTSTIYDTLVVN